MDVLLVCTANVARSPLAEAMLASAGVPGIEVGSAGVRARDGYPAADGTIALAEARGLDVSGHRSRLVTPDLVVSSELILTMSDRQREACTMLSTRATGRTFMLLEFVRLLEAVDLDAAPSDPAERPRWIRDAAHRARPMARPPAGSENIADPMGRAWPEWEAMGEQLDAVIGRIAAVLAPEATPPPDVTG